MLCGIVVIVGVSVILNLVQFIVMAVDSLCICVVMFMLVFLLSLFVSISVCSCT